MADNPLKIKNCHIPNSFVIREITGWYGNMAILERKIFKNKSYYFTLHSNKPQDRVSGCFSSSLTALVFTGSKFTMQATPRLHG